ncbi:10845_t:CDS:10 [Diversispora eburnea]|uniref:10845_t:CDS:1 n=1 Tax=Diversispora eburnea TaxID=1213867 RepID=A0A9N8WMV6_9GLOM|nr:10845_t:CDS:10 [Diversispora eburnea]
MLILQNFINGEFHTTRETTYIEGYNPSTGKAHAKIPNSTQKDVDLAVEAAKNAFPKWSKTPRVKRAQMLYKIADALELRLKEFASAEVQDQGKTITFATNVDITRSVYNFRFFAGYILHEEEKANVMEGKCFNYVQKEPAGVAAELASVTANMFCSVLKEAKLPDGVINIIFGYGATTGHQLISHPDVPLVSFTGGTETGKKVNIAAAPFFKKVSLELGGKNANILFEDCDFEKAVETSILSSFSNQGEICLCGSRIFVHSSIYDNFLESFVHKAENLIVGNPNDPNTQIGALNSKQHMEKVLGYIELAKSEGGVIKCGGKRKEMTGDYSEGYFVEPTVITNRVAHEEIFGPVVTVHPFESEDEVIKYANDSQHGLSCSIWTQNGSRQRRVAESIHVGTCWVNCWLIRDLAMPFGGMKKSGLGREGGEYSISFFTNPKTICLAD